jgi:4-amino-4-deoxy-L-arabinose transferase-like glycosyltransferase
LTELRPVPSIAAVDPAEAIRRETMFVAWTALALGLVALAYCVRHGTLLLYGDAVAHLHIARRVFDSITPGFRQLGSVWLPLPHILLMPFVWNMGWWHSGLAGACLSVPSYVLGCAGIYRLARMWLDMPAAVVAVAFYGLNPGLLYMATTAMTEPLFLAEMIWAVLLIVQYQRALRDTEPSGGASASRLLIRAGLVMVGAIFTRYDGWVYAAAAWLFVTWALLAARRRWTWRGPDAGAWVLFTALLSAAPSLWLAYNAKQFGDPLDFIRGPYSARAIEARTTPPGSSPHPGVHNLRVSALYFLKAAQLGAAPLRFGRQLCWISVAGTLAALWAFRRRQIWPVLLLWLPLPFYAYSVAYGSVPIFIPIWRPFSWYNTRYGMELLPAFALFTSCLIPVVLSRLHRVRRYALLASFLLVVANSVVLLRARPLVFQEAVVNSRSRIAFETALANALLGIPGNGLILMRVSTDVGAVQQAAIPLRRIVNEGDYLTWQRALEAPARSVSTVVAFDGDVVSQAVQRHPEGLQMSNVICSTGQPCARIYRSQFAK